MGRVGQMGKCQGSRVLKGSANERPVRDPLPQKALTHMGCMTFHLLHNHGTPTEKASMQMGFSTEMRQMHSPPLLMNLAFFCSLVFMSISATWG